MSDPWDMLWWFLFIGMAIALLQTTTGFFNALGFRVSDWWTSRKESIDSLYDSGGEPIAFGEKYIISGEIYYKRQERIKECHPRSALRRKCRPLTGRNRTRIEIEE
jgi:hypothetical protein